MSVKLLIDGDVLCYRSGFATDKTKYLVEKAEGVGFTPASYYYFDTSKEAKEFGPDPSLFRLWSRKETEPEDKALMLVDVMLGDIRAHYASENPTVHCYLSGVGNYRNSIATRANYKGNRSGSVPPTHLKAIRSHLVTKWGAELSQGEEADDRLGIEATKHRWSSIVCSIDKDLLQLPGRHYDFVKKEETTVSAKEAVINFYSQVISGDSTDNIPGATGFGPVKARKALEGTRSPWDCWQAALTIYTREFGDISGPLHALEAARLVYVRRTEGELWSPPVEAQKTKTLKVA